MNTNNLYPLCNGGQKQAGLTTFTVDLGFGVIVVRAVPALICDLCGTDWLEDDVAEKLERIVEQARHKNSLVEITLWQEENQTLLL